MEKNWIALSDHPSSVLRDVNGVPVEWTLFSVGDTPFCQEGRDGLIRLTSEDIDAIIDHYRKKGEDIPVDSDHYLYYLAKKHGVEEDVALKLVPSGVAAMGFGALSRQGNDLRIHVTWTPGAHEFLREKIFKYFSPVIQGLKTGPLRVTSVALTNVPAINNLDALAARSEPNNGKAPLMKNLEKALGRLLGRDTIALSAESTNDGDIAKLAAEVEEKASVLEKVKDLLNLAADATLDQIVAALTAELEKAKTAEEKQAQLDEIAAKAESEEHARLVAKGRAERKIVDADMDYVNSLDSKALSAYLDHAAPKFPAALPKDAGRPQDPDAVTLTAEDKAACRRLNIPEEKFLEAKIERMK